MNRTIPILLAALLLMASPALAKAPTLADLPTVKMVNEEAANIAAVRREKELEDLKDPMMDLIKEYAGHGVNYWQYQKITDILNDDKQDMKYRRAAAEALVNKFNEEDAWEPQVKKVKLRIGSGLLPRLHDRNTEIRHLVARIYEKYFPGQYTRFGYDPEETVYNKRNRAVKKWRGFLGNSR